MEDKLYKNKYFIAIYDKEDSLCYLFNNAHEIASSFNKNEKSVRVALSNALNKNYTKMVLNGKKYTIHLFKD